MKLRLLLEYFHPWPNAAGFFVARALGLYHAAGLDVEIGVHDPARGDTLAHLLRQDADLGVFPTNRLLVRREAGEKLAALATVNHVALETIQTFVGSGINRPRDLAGRRVAYNPTPRGRAMVRHLVAADGGDPDQVITIDSGVREWSVDDLAAGAADATYGGYWVWDALFGTLPPAQRITWRVQDIGAPPYPSYLLGGHEDGLRENSAAIEAFLAATGAGFAHAAADPDHALHVLEQITPYFPPSVMAASLRLVAPTWTDGGTWGRHRPDLMRPYAAWMAEHHLLRDASTWQDAFMTPGHATSIGKGADRAGGASAISHHGTGTDRVMPDWPSLTVTELAPVLAAYPGLGPASAVSWHSPRPFAASGIVACAARNVFVKRHHSAVRSAADLAEEHRFIAHLRAAGAPVPTVLADEDGRTAIEIGNRTYEVHAISPGLDLYRDHKSWLPIHGHRHAREAGRAVGVLHRAAAGFAAPPRRTDMLVAAFALFDSPDPLAAVAERAARTPALAAALAGRPWRADMERVLLPWHAALAPHLGALTPLWSHNDLHASNLLWTASGGVSTVLDFGMCNRTSAVFDLATAIERNAMDWLFLAEGAIDIGHADLAAMLIRGYRETHDLTPAQAAALPHLLPLVHVDFALSELAYFHGITRSDANAELAYTHFLLGHAAWFATPPGRAFVAALGEALARQADPL